MCVCVCVITPSRNVAFEKHEGDGDSFGARARGGDGGVSRGKIKGEQMGQPPGAVYRPKGHLNSHGTLVGGYNEEWGGAIQWILTRGDIRRREKVDSLPINRNIM